MSLRDELLNEIADIIESTGVEESNPMWHRDSSLHYAKEILECISKHLPEKKEFVDERGFYDDKTKLALINNFKGYNQALTDINKLLTTNKKEGK